MSNNAQKQESRISSALLKDNTTIKDTSEPPPQASSPAASPPAKTTLSLSKPRSFKIIVLGESGVGKTCLSFRFCAGRFPMNTEATIGLDFREKIVEIDGERLKLQLWDTAGQERFKRSITHHYYRSVDAVVFVYDVNSISSLDSLDSWVDEVEMHGVPLTVPRVLVGNKCDAGGQVVTTGTAQRWADDRGMPLFETSAKDDSHADHVDGIFLTLAHKLVAGKSLIKPVPDPSDPDTQPVRVLYQSSIAAPPDNDQDSCCF